MTQMLTNFIEKNPIAFRSKIMGRTVFISPSDVAKVVVETNVYLHSLSGLFNELDFNIFNNLGQRNLSGFIGEVFTHVFARIIVGFKHNPHADGRPDLLYIPPQEEEVLAFFQKGFSELADGADFLPKRSIFAPFKYGGLEIKTTIGNPVSGYKKKLQNDLGVRDFSVGLPRIKYLGSITFWGHHTSCDNLVGLYYDFCEEMCGTPQIMAVMHANLDPGLDWRPVSVGKSGSKKTSNTSLSKSGQDKILGCPVVVVNQLQYKTILSQIGLQI